MTLTLEPEKVFDQMVIKKGSNYKFNKHGYQKKPHLLKLASKRIISQLSNLEIEGVCALGTSGLTLGLFLSQELAIPLYFYKSSGFPRFKNGRKLKILPEPETTTRVILADSHYNESYTWANAQKYLQTYSPLDPIAICLVVHPDINKPLAECTIPAISACKVSEISEYIKNKFGLQTHDEFVGLFKPGTEFWESDSRPLNVGEPGKYFRHAKKMIPKSFSKPRFHLLPISDGLQSRVKAIPINDPGIWTNFLYPDLLQDLVIEIGNSYDFKKYEALIGVSYLGTALASTIAYYNPKSFKDNLPVYSSYLERHIVPTPIENEIVGKEVLLCQMRFTSGLFTNDALNLIKKEKAICTNLLTIRTDLSIEPKRRQYAIRQLGELDILTITLA